MEVKNSLAKKDKEEKLTFSQQINTDIYKSLIRNALQDDYKVTRFITSIVSAVSANPALQKCTTASIVSAALQGEALGLSPSPSLGEYAIVPYGKDWDSEKKDYKTYIGQFQIMTNGIIQLAMRTGLYKDLGGGEIREGEYKGKDKRTGKPVIEFIEDDDERETKPIIGYFAYFELSNGFFRSTYLPKQNVINHVIRYSKAFDYAVYQKVEKGERLKDWKEENKAEMPWIKDFDKMAVNLATRKVLKNAPKSIEMRNAESYEEKNENIADAFIPADEKDGKFILFGNSDNNEVPQIAEQTETEIEKKDEKDIKKKGKKTSSEEKVESENNQPEQVQFFQ